MTNDWFDLTSSYEDIKPPNKSLYDNLNQSYGTLVMNRKNISYMLFNLTDSSREVDALVNKTALFNETTQNLTQMLKDLESRGR